MEGGVRSQRVQVIGLRAAGKVLGLASDESVQVRKERFKLAEQITT